MLIVTCFQANTETLGAVHPIREPAPGESRGSGPAGQAAALRPPAEADGGRGHAAPVLLLVPRALPEPQHNSTTAVC